MLIFINNKVIFLYKTIDPLLRLGLTFSLERIFRKNMLCIEMIVIPICLTSILLDKIIKKIFDLF